MRRFFYIGETVCVAPAAERREAQGLKGETVCVAPAAERREAQGLKGETVCVAPAAERREANKEILLNKREEV